MKQRRQEKILELIRRYDIETQEDLAKYLVEAGIPVTQATVSRDIRELNLTKVAGKSGRSQYASMDYGGNNLSADTARYVRVLKEGMVSMQQADNLLVIKTVSGMAMAVAAAVDALGIDGIVGSIAGDDTIMCAIKTASMVPTVMDKIEQLN